MSSRELIILGIDTMVIDNDEAKKREGVEPTCKKVKGFQPLQLYWGRYLIDAIFRNGKSYSNYGDHVIRMISTIVKLIRLSCRSSLPFTADAASVGTCFIVTDIIPLTWYATTFPRHCLDVAGKIV